MLEQFLNHINQNDLCDRSDTVLLAVSGGVDSMAMLYLFREAGFQVGVAHCNFQLRGKESEADEEFVRHVCKELDVPFYSRRFETEAYAWENTLSIQMAARELRYAWFEELLVKNTFRCLATGHHFDDSIETILLNLTRGSATDGLAGIPLKNGNVIRPLLFATRKQIEKYAAAKGIVWREDLSNMTDDYQRNFIRHQVVPKLKELNPSLEVTWQSGIDKIHGDLALLHHAFADWKKQFITESVEKIAIQKNAFLAFPRGGSLLWRYIKNFGFNFEQSKEIITSLYGQPGKRFFSSTHLLVVDRDLLIISVVQHDWNEVVIDQGQSLFQLGPWRLSLESVHGLPEIFIESEAYIDESKLTFPLTWRKWKAGDVFFPLGMEHKKKLSDFFIDKKVSIADKELVTVIESEGKIAWVAGHRIDDRFKVTSKTTSVLKFSLTRA